MSLPPVPSLQTVRERLPMIFPEGIENRAYCIRESTAKTVLTMLYAGAIDGTSRWIRPSQVTDMCDEQLAKVNEEEREAWVALMLSARKKNRPINPWYAVNSREQIRDENLRQGLITNAAAIERQGLPVTTSLPKYALKSDFAALLDESLSGESLANAIGAWQDKHLNKAALSRIAIIRRGAAASEHRVSVAFPGGSAITLSPGQSSVITKAVIEEFATRFLHNPAVLWVSESGNKVINNELTKALKINIDPSKSLPDVILVDLAAPKGLLIVFVEVVHSDGPVNQQRKEELQAIAAGAGFEPDHLAFLTAFTDRNTDPYKRLAPNLAWDSFVWFASEPDSVVLLKRGSERKLTELI